MKSILYWVAKLSKIVVIMGIVTVSVFLAVVELKGFKLVTVESGSMEPKIRVGDLVVVSPLANWPRVGEVISFQSRINQQETITHRVYSVNIKEGYLVTKGDNLQSTDPPLRLHQITGIMRLRSTLAGRIVKLLRNPVGLIVGVYIPGILMIISEAKILNRSLHRRNNYTISSSRNRIMYG